VRTFWRWLLHGLRWEGGIIRSANRAVTSFTTHFLVVETGNLSKNGANAQSAPIRIEPLTNFNTRNRFSDVLSRNNSTGDTGTPTFTIVFHSLGDSPTAYLVPA
jgi:hypothetical protein